MEYWFWTILYVLIILWYIIVTLVVAIGGWKNIKEMITVLKNK
ncbi:MAG: hypothetical protein AB3N14_04385 [Flavobacteriaceae bacterium]